MPPMLALEHLSCGYGGGIIAVHDLDIKLGEGEVFALIGPNGAGKTSAIMCIAGHVRVRGGDIRLRGRSLLGVPAAERVHRGIALVPEGRRLFSNLTVLENLLVGGYRLSRGEQRSGLQEVYACFPRLAERKAQLAASLSGGEQQMLAIGRAMMARPNLIMIDELSLGLMPKAIDVCYNALGRLRDEGLTVLLVEQNTERALQFAERVCVLESGSVVWTGTAAAARDDTGFTRRYLGMRD
jgi:branched-chain amino acid transport system ATP-binding protein